MSGRGPCGSRTRAPLDLAAPELVADPYPAYARARELGPVVRLEDWGCFAVLGRRPCAHVLSAEDVFDASGQPLLRRLQRDVLGGVRTWQAPDFAMPSGPEFRVQRMRGRRTTGRALANSFVDGLWPGFEEACRQRADELAASCARGPIDLVGDYAVPLVTDFLAALIAIGPEGLPAFRQWVEAGLGAMPAAGEPDRADSRVVLRLLGRLVLERHRHPRDDFLGHLVANPGAHRADGSPLAAHLEFVVSTALMISRVTHQGLTLSFSTLLNALIDHPEQFARLRVDRGLLAGAVEEGLRFDASTQALGRVARTGVEFEGTVVPSGSLLVVFVGAANRDGAEWSEPDRFDITRGAQESARHLSFGQGSWSCLGAGMSRRVLAVMLDALVDRFASLSAAGAARRFPEFATRGLTTLPVSAVPVERAVERDPNVDVA